MAPRTNDIFAGAGTSPSCRPFAPAARQDAPDTYEKDEAHDEDTPEGPLRADRQWRYHASGSDHQRRKRCAGRGPLLSAVTQNSTPWT